MSARNTINNFMERIPFCILAAGLIGGAIYSMMSCASCNAFSQSLDVNQAALYQHIIEERRNLALKGLLWGLLASALYLWFAGLSMNPMVNGCIYAGITLFVQYYYYMLSGKSTYMVEHLNTPEQLSLYAQSNRTMQQRALMGTLLGYLGFAFIPYLLGMFK